jgi:hypothetical protein
MVRISIQGDGGFAVKVAVTADLAVAGPCECALHVGEAAVAVSVSGTFVGELKKADAETVRQWAALNRFSVARIWCAGRVLNDAEAVVGETGEILLDVPLAQMRRELDQERRREESDRDRRRESVPEQTRRRQTHDLAWVAAIFLITLATATIGSYLGIQWFLRDVSTRLRDKLDR